MATIRVTLTGQATTEATVGIPDEARFLAWVGSVYPGATLTDRLSAWWAATMAGTAANVESFERTQAAQEAIEGVQAMLAPPVWRAGIAVTVGQRYYHNGVVYRVIQAHTTLANWTPNVVPALFAVEG